MRLKCRERRQSGFSRYDKLFSDKLARLLQRREERRWVGIRPWVLGCSLLASHPPASRSPCDFARVTYPLWALPLENSSRQLLRRCSRIRRLRSQAPVCWGEGTGDEQGLAGDGPRMPDALPRS